MNATKTGIALAALLLLCAALAAPAAAQQAQRQTLRAQTAAGGLLPAEMQRQLEAEVARRGNPNCGADCQPAAGSRLAAPGGGGGGLGYVCNDGSCACAGACDCAVMGSICAPNTLGCSDYGCTCAEADDAEHPEQGACD